MPLLIEGLSFSYGEREIFRDFNVELHEQKMTALMGPSGSGKSTLLGLLVGQLTPHSGRIEYPTPLLSRSRVDRSRIAWIMQSANVFGRRTAFENVILPLRLKYASGEEQKARGAQALAAVRLTERANDRAGKLSGGEKQRVAVARAIAMQAPLLIADEPTVALDKTNRTSLIKALRQCALSGAIVLIATHDPEVAEACDSIVTL